MSIQDKIKRLKSLSTGLESQLKQKSYSKEEFENIKTLLATKKFEYVELLSEIEDVLLGNHLAKSYGKIDYELLAKKVKEVSIEYFIGDNPAKGTELTSLVPEILKYKDIPEGMPPLQVNDIVKLVNINISDYMKEEKKVILPSLRLVIERKDMFDLGIYLESLEFLFTNVLSKYSPDITLNIDSKLSTIVLKKLTTILDKVHGSSGYKLTIYTPVANYPAIKDYKAITPIFDSSNIVEIKKEDERKLNDVLAHSLERNIKSIPDGMNVMFLGNKSYFKSSNDVKDLVSRGTNNITIFDLDAKKLIKYK